MRGRSGHIKRPHCSHAQSRDSPQAGGAEAQTPRALLSGGFGCNHGSRERQKSESKLTSSLSVLLTRALAGSWAERCSLPPAACYRTSALRAPPQQFILDKLMCQQSFTRACKKTPGASGLSRGQGGEERKAKQKNIA